MLARHKISSRREVIYKVALRSCSSFIVQLPTLIMDKEVHMYKNVRILVTNAFCRCAPNSSFQNTILATVVRLSRVHVQRVKYRKSNVEPLGKLLINN
jgi:hypothetical protein